MATAPCPVCGDTITVRANGTMRSHSDKTKPRHGLPWHPHCEGSGQPAVQAHAYCERVTATPTSPVHIRAVGPEGLKPGGGIPRGTLALCGGEIGAGWDLPGPVDGTTDQAAAIPQDQPGRHCLRCIDAYRTATA